MIFSEVRRHVHTKTRIALTAIILASGAVCLLAPDQAQAKDTKERVEDLRYGRALYYYFQDQEMNALTELKLAEVRGGIQGHGDNPELMKAGISLAYGMADEAQEIFVELLDQNRPEDVRNAAWYHLARLHYLRENWESSYEAANHITNNLDEALTANVQMIRTDLAIKTGRLDDALVLIRNKKAYGEFLPYAYFNVGTALSRQESNGEAIAYYDEAIDALYDLEPVTESDLALADKIRTAAGYNYLLAGYNQAALRMFDKVQLKSLDSDMALLGYGRASMESSDYLEALKPWNELAQRSLVTPAAQEALLSMPVAYEELGATGEALAAYEFAEATYLSELDRIEELLGFLRENRLAAAASLNEPANWFETRAEAASAPKALQLAELFSLNRFQAQVHEFQDISQLRDMINRWTDRLDLYSNMLDERQLLREEEINQFEALDLEREIRNLTFDAQELRDNIESIRRDNDYLALVTGDAADLLERSDNSQERISKLKEMGEDTGDSEESLRLYSGLLLWEAAENFSEELYVSQKSVVAMEQELQALKDTNSRVKQIFFEAPDIAPYQNRISDLRASLQEGSDQLDSMIDKAEQQLLAEIVSELNTQHRRLRVYLSQARLSIARIYDASSQGFRQ